MRTIRKLILLCGIAALLAVNTLSPVARADELRIQDKTALEGNKGRRPGGGRGHGGGGRGHGGGRRHGGSGWGWAGFGAAVGLGVLSGVTSDSSHSYTYVQPAPTYQVVQPAPQVVYAAPQVVYPAPTYYYYPSTTYAQPSYVQPNYGQTYMAPPAPCNACP